MTSSNTEPTQQKQTPPDIHKRRQWIETEKKNKRPKVKAWENPENHNVFTPSRSGFVHSQHDQYITIDVDVDSTGQKPNSTTHIPEEITALLEEHPTYTETSLSGQGQHILYKLDSSSHLILNQVVGRITLNETTKGELFHHTGYVIYTLKPSPLSPPDTPIATIALQDLQDALPELAIQSLMTRAIPQQPSSGQRDPNENIDDIINRIPGKVYRIPYFDTPKAQRIIAGLNIPVNSNYDWWLTIGMALSDLASCTTNEVDAQRCYQAFLLWSEQDESFVSEQDVARHYKSFGNKPHKDITYRTLISIINLTNPKWVWFVQKNGKNTTIPEPREIENLKPLVESTGFKFLFNVVKKTWAVESDDMPRMEVSREGLESKIHELMATNGMRTVTTPLARTYAKMTALSQEEFNPIKDWMDEKPWDKKNRLPSLYSTIKTSRFDQEFRELYETFIYKNLMALVANNFYDGPYGGTKGVVILQGPQNARKSTWLRKLLPHHLKDYVCPSMMDPGSRGSFSKDFNLEAGSFAILIYDEIERIIKKLDTGIVKNFLTQDTDVYRPVYGTGVSINKRYSTFWGTTNDGEIKGDATGVRRFWVIPIESCDTTHDINMQQVYAQVKVEMETLLASRGQDDNMPWDLTIDEIKLNALNMSDKTSASDLDMLVHEVEDEFDLDFNVRAFTNNGSGPNLKVVETQRKVLAYFNTMGAETSMAKLKHALNRYCGKWTNTIGRKTTYPNVQGYVKDGKWFTCNKSKASYYLLPHLTAEAKVEADLK